ncbi:MAG: hypothetical protein K0R45_2645, partial [Pseudomonas sp.]|nr:hypothetical protein [Pseudomonas sp.]
MNSHTSNPRQRSLPLALLASAVLGSTLLASTAALANTPVA